MRGGGADCSPHGQGVPCRCVGPSTPPPATPYRAFGVLVVRKESGKSWLYVLTVAGPPGEILCRTCGPDFYPADRTYPQLLPRQSCPAPSVGLVCGMREWGAGCISRRSRALCARSFRTCDADSCPADWIYPRPPPPALPYRVCGKWWWFAWYPLSTPRSTLGYIQEGAILE